MRQFISQYFGAILFIGLMILIGVSIVKNVNQESHCAESGRRCQCQEKYPPYWDKSWCDQYVTHER